MNTEQIAPSTPMMLDSAPAWMLYVYDEIAYLAYRGQLVATSAQSGRIERLFQRLTTATTPR